MNISRMTIVLAGLLLASGAQAQTRERQQESLDAYLPYAGAPVDRFQFWKLTDWQLVGENKVIVWPRLNQAFLLTVDEPCMDLEWANAIAVTSSTHMVSVRFEAGKDTCRINEIRPIDYKKYRQDRAAAKGDGKSL